jgi:hypothetical protein
VWIVYHDSEPEDIILGVFDNVEDATSSPKRSARVGRRAC